MYSDTDVCGMDVFVLGDEVVAENGCKELWRSDWVLFRKNIDSLLLSIGRYNDGVVCLGVSNRVRLYPCPALR